MHQTQNNDFINHIVDVYSDMIFRIAFLHTKNRSDAEDVVQDVFLSLMKQPPFNDEEHLKAWIIRVAINKCKNIVKSARRNKTVPLDEEHHKLQSTNEEYSELIEGLQKLPEKERNILYLFYYEGYTAKEIALIMHKRENAIFVRLNRARDKLKQFLSK